MKPKIIISSLLACVALMGCKTLDKANAEPAVLIDFDPQAEAEIATIINEVMPGANVKLADDILSKDNRLFIQRSPTMVDGNPIEGRITEMPRKFELYRSNDACFLVDDKTGESYLLKHASCRPVE